MNIFLKYTSIFFLLLISSFSAYANVKVKFINSTKETIKYDHEMKELGSLVNVTFKNNSYFLEAKKSVSIFAGDSFVLENKYNIEFMNSYLVCSFIHILGSPFAHGWGVFIKINGKESGIICANKTTVIDISNHANIEYAKDLNDESYLNFYNTGWWENNALFPTSMQIALKNYN